METLLTVLYDILRFGFFIVFVSLHGAIMAGLVLEWNRNKKTLGNAANPFVSVIIPVHNEIKRMDGILGSLSRQDYSNAEIIFVNDRSTDDSDIALQKFSQEMPAAKIITLTENPGPNFKQYALGKGIEVSKGEFILFTDADCEVPPGWIGSMVRRISDPAIGASLGPVLRKTGNSGFFYLYQCFEHAVRYMYLAGSTGLGAAGGGFGNNLIVRRESLDAIGGYAAVPPTPTEDAALIAKIRSQAKYRILAGLGSDLHVITHNETCWKDLVTQTLRWNNGGLFSPDFSTRFNFNFLMITISTGIIAMPFLPFIPSLWPFSLAVLISMTANTIATLKLFGVSLPKKGAAYILQCVFTPMYFTFLTILGFCGVKPEWKGKKLDV